MLKQEELAFIKALSSMDFSTGLIKEVRAALAARRKKRPAVPAWNHRTTGGVPGASQRTSTSTRPAEKRKATELASSGDPSEPATRRQATSSPSEQQCSAVTGEQAATGGRQLGSPEAGMTYAAVVAASVAPQPPSGPLKLAANGSDPSEPAVSTESAPRRMSSDMSGPLSGMPVGATTNTHLASTCVPAGQRPNKTPIFITGVADTRDFLAWLRASCPSELTAQLKGEKLMVVPSTADGFRATVCGLHFLDEGKGVSFHTFSLPEDRCVRLLVKNLGQRMPESAVREELESLNIQVQGVMQLRSNRRDQDPAKDRPPPTSLYQWRGARGVKSTVCYTTLRSASDGRDVRSTEGAVAMQTLPALRTHAA